jgi:hypothetical protein
MEIVEPPAKELRFVVGIVRRLGKRKLFDGVGEKP